MAFQQLWSKTFYKAQFTSQYQHWHICDRERDGQILLSLLPVADHSCWPEALEAHQPLFPEWMSSYKHICPWQVRLLWQRVSVHKTIMGWITGSWNNWIWNYPEEMHLWETCLSWPSQSTYLCAISFKSPGHNNIAFPLYSEAPANNKSSTTS